MKCPWICFIVLVGLGSVRAEDGVDCAPINSAVHPIEVNAKCSNTTFQVKFNSQENFYSSLEFGVDEKCKGDVNFQLLLDNCTIADVSKADIPGGQVLVVNKDVGNVISGNKVELELKNNTLKVKGGGKGFQLNSSCSLNESDTKEETKARIQMINSKEGCNVKVMLDPDATYQSPGLLEGIFVMTGNKLLIITIVLMTIALVLLLIFVVLWYNDKLPGSSRASAPSHCTYITRDVFSTPEPKPYLQHECRSPSVRQQSIESEAEIFEPAEKPRRSIISLYSNHEERRIA